MQVRYVLFSIILISFLVHPVKSFGFSYCEEPHKPYCAEDYLPFDNKEDFETCKMQAEMYISSVNQYIECKNKEIIDKQNEAKNVIRGFETKLTLSH